MEKLNEASSEWSDDMFDLIEKFYGHAYWALEAGVEKEVLLQELDEAAECLEEPKKDRNPADYDTDRNRSWGGDRVTDDLLMCVCSKPCATSLWNKEEKLQSEFASPSVMWNCIRAMRDVRDAYGNANMGLEVDL
jgi:hypothetical protein